MSLVTRVVAPSRRRLAVVTLLAGVFLPASFFHTHLVKSTPAAGGRVAASPQVIRLWFTKEPKLAATRVTLVGAKGDTIPLGAVVRDRAEPRAVAVPVTTALHLGTYRVLWRTAAADGHSVHGQFDFLVVRAGPGGR